MSKNEKYKYAKILSLNNKNQPRELVISIPDGVDERDCKVNISYLDGTMETLYPAEHKNLDYDFFTISLATIQEGLAVNNALYDYIKFGLPDDNALGHFKVLRSSCEVPDENGKVHDMQPLFATVTVTYEIKGEVVDYQVFPSWYHYCGIFDVCYDDEI